MSQAINKTQQKTTLYYWEKEIHQAPKIHSLTKISIRTIYYNIKKSEKKERKAQRGKWPQKSITGADARRIGSNSPDPDPIENLWNIVKTNVERRKLKNCRKLEWL